MNLVTILLIAIVFWFLWSLLKSYKSLENQIRLVGLKCQGGVQDSSKGKVTAANSLVQTHSPGPFDTIKHGLIGALTGLSAGI